MSASVTVTVTAADTFELYNWQNDSKTDRPEILSHRLPLDEDGRQTSEVDLSPGPVSHVLPPVDRGRQAWLFLAGCFLLEGLVWGLPFSFGVFQVYYSTHEPFSSEQGNIATIGTTCVGIMYLASPLTAIAIQRWPNTRRPAMFIGFVIMIVSLVAASFCETTTTLLATQGVLYGLGGLIMYFPGMAFVDEWFVARKGIAFGIMWAGTGMAGAVVPFVLQWLLDQYGYKSTLRIWAIVTTILSLPCLYFVRPRLPNPSASALRPRDFGFLKRAPFWIFELGVIAQSLGANLPGLYLPSFALYIGLPAYAGPLALALYNLAASFGVIGLGLLVDLYHVTVAILVATIGSVIGTFIFWGLAQSQAMLYLFAIIAGAFTAGFTSTWSGNAVAIRRLEPHNNIDIGVVIALLAAGKGVGAVISGPLSERLLRLGWSAGGSGSFAYGTPYGALVVFSGASAILGGVACVGRLLKLV